jgi:hypothetical protein
MSSAPEGRGGDSQSIGTVTIDPDAERVGATSIVSSRQEQAFFDQGKAEYDLKMAHANLGTLGRFFGASTSAAVNIAGFVAILLIIVFCATFLMPDKADLPDLRKSLLALVGSILGFIFGAATASKKD